MPSWPSATTDCGIGLAITTVSPLFCTFALPISKGAAFSGSARKVSSSTLPNASGVMRSEEHTSELQSLMRISYAVFCLKKKNNEEEKQEEIKGVRTTTR